MPASPSTGSTVESPATSEHPASPSQAAATLTLHRARVTSAQPAQPTGPVAAPASQSGDHLLIVEVDSSSIFELPATGELLIGRAPDTQIRLRDPSSSRLHARLSMGPKGPVLTDLGSYNGTRVNGERIASPRLLQPGDTIAICDVVLLYRRRQPAALLRPIHDSIAPLRERLEEELDRAQTGYRTLSLVVVDLTGLAEVASHLAQVAAQLSPSLRSMDCVAQDGERRLVLLLPESIAAQAVALAQVLLQRMATLTPGARAGVACFPDDGQDSASLLSGAHAAADSAPALQVRTASSAVTRLRVGEHEILLADAAMLRLYALLERLAVSELPVLIHGETGTGKELAAQVLHSRSSRRDKRLVSINCAALPESLAESELFGHERGAFSGAVATKVGLLEAGHGGTVFLDEVGELPLSLQAKLLRVLENKRLVRVGDTRERPVDIRIVAATNRHLDAEVKSGRFRQDLYFRLASAVIVLPPLRERPRELPILARAFLAQASAKLGREPLLLAPAALERLLRYAWPGNVRELRNAMDYAAAVVSEPIVETEHLPPAILSATAPPQPIRQDRLESHETQALPLAETPSLTQLARAILRIDAPDKLAAIEDAIVQEALVLTDGNKSAAARLLGVHRKVIERRLAKDAAPSPPSRA
ncbi:MAG: sigma 54-interacting transcriptional regulator [Myxococcales bacterium]|nr:sigma 54-interacting transcriptional regulator [Myxococcales bacterium]